MGLFTKSIGPVFLKKSNQATEYIDKLKVLLEKCSGELKEEIEKQITIAEYGIKGEESIAFELKNSGIDMYILQDICLEYGDLSAQIDYIIITRKRSYIIECKNLIGDIEINSSGDFIRTYQIKGRKIKEGIYSPITQNARHLQVLRELRKASKGNVIARMIFDKYFDENYKSIVVLANPKTVLNAKYAKKEVKEQIVRGDQLIHKIKEMDKLVTDAMAEKDMLEIANFYLQNNKELRLDYAEKYNQILEKLENHVEENACTKLVEDVNSTTGEFIEKLIKELKAFRLEQSRKEKIKPYFIFNDAQMEDLIKKNPKTKDELCLVSGFGRVKAEKYGEQILAIIRANRM